VSLGVDRPGLLRPRPFRILAAVAFLVALAGGIFVYDHFFRRAPAPFFASDEDYFLFG
jgi:hypothetical protein